MVKPVEQFGKHSSNKSGVTSLCKLCRNFAWKLRRYKITEEQFWQMHDDQKGLCAICIMKYIEVIDHCHKTDTVRALLCTSCNLMLGHALEEPHILEAGADYLRRFT